MSRLATTSETAQEHASQAKQREGRRLWHGLSSTDVFAEVARQHEEVRKFNFAIAVDVTLSVVSDVVAEVA